MNYRINQLVVALVMGLGTVLFSNPSETLGFEVEFRGDFNPRVFPFLQERVEEEETGNKEVKSLVFQSEDQMLLALKSVVQFLGDARRSIHIHRRIPKASDPEKEAIAAGIASRLGDIVFLWRLERAPKIATTYWSQERRSPIGITTNKGTVYLQDLGKEWDFETRGVYDDPELGAQISKLFSDALKQKGKFKSLHSIQTGLFLRTEGLSEMMEKYAQEEGVDLNETKRERIRQLERAVRYSALLPLFHYEDLPGLKRNEKKKIKDATKSFKEEVYALISGRTPSDSLPFKFRNLLSDWAQESQLRSTLTEDLFRRSSDDRSQKEGREFLKERIEEAKQSKQSRLRSEAEAVEKGSNLSDWTVELVKEELQKAAPSEDVLLRLRGLDGPKWKETVKEILTHENPNARKAGAELLFRSANRCPLDLVQFALDREQHPEVRELLLELLPYLMNRGARFSVLGQRAQTVAVPRHHGTFSRLRGLCLTVLGLAGSEN